MLSAPFRFNEEDHAYTVDGQRVPHITGLLTVAGWTDERWYDDECSERGRYVHKRTAEFDLNAVTLRTLQKPEEPYRGFTLGYVAWLNMVRPRWAHVETAAVHPELKFGGRPDRVGRVFQLHSVCELKTGSIEKGHMVQTALQAILVAPELRLPAESISRWAVYVDERGRYKMEEHRNTGPDFREARRILRRYCNHGERREGKP